MMMFEELVFFFLPESKQAKESDSEGFEYAMRPKRKRIGSLKIREKGKKIFFASFAKVCSSTDQDRGCWMLKILYIYIKK